jgi:DNA-binding CsgD family transcriptional regulator
MSVQDPGAHRRLMDAVAAASRGDVLSLGARGVAVPLGPPDGPRWIANVLPLASGARRDAALGYSAEAAIFLRAADQPITSGIEAVAAIYKLTPSEIRVLQSVFKHARVADIGTALGLSAATVKTHLASLFGKTGTSRRADLIQAVMARGRSPI